MSPVQYGMDTAIGLAMESVWGTAVAPGSGDFNRVRSSGWKNQGEETPGNQNLGIAFPTGERGHLRRSEGSISIDLKYQGYERFLDHFFGKASRATTGPTDTDCYTHIWTPKIARQVGATMYKKIGDTVSGQLQKFPGCRFDRLRFAFNKGVLGMDIEGIGKMTAAPVTPSAVTFQEDVTGNPDINAIEDDASHGFTFEYGASGSSPSYSELGIVDSSVEFQIPLDKKAENLGDVEITEPTPSGKHTYSGSVKRDFVDDTFIDLWLAGGLVAMRWTYLGGIATGTTHWTFELEAKYARLRSAGPDVREPGRIPENLDFKFTSPDGSTSPFTLKLINHRTSASIGTP